MAKLTACTSYPCWEYHNTPYRWDNLTTRKLRRRHSTHGISVSSDPIVKGTFLRDRDDMFVSLIHKGKKR